MADVNRWVELELARQMGPVSAPAGLWGQIQEKRVRRSRMMTGWVLWPAVAAVLLIAAVELVWQVGRARGATIDLAQLTAPELQELADAKNGFVFSSDDPTEIRHWVKAHGGIDIELPVARAANVRLLGARLLPMRGTLVAAVKYRVNDDDATLLVSNKKFPLPVSKHRVSSIEMGGNERLLSWSMSDQVYAIAFSGAGDGRSACGLCHIRGL